MSTPTLMVVGNLEQIISKLEQVDSICSSRESEGFNPEDIKFTYQFIAAATCCQHCEQLDGTFYHGPFILSEFPFAVQIGEDVWLVGYHPNCQCILLLINKIEGAVESLYEELVVVEV